MSLVTRGLTRSCLKCLESCPEAWEVDSHYLRFDLVLSSVTQVLTWTFLESLKTWIRFALYSPVSRAGRGSWYFVRLRWIPKTVTERGRIKKKSEYPGDRVEKALKMCRQKVDFTWKCSLHFCSQQLSHGLNKSTSLKVSKVAFVLLKH